MSDEEMTILMRFNVIAMTRVKNTEWVRSASDAPPFLLRHTSVHHVAMSVVPILTWFEWELLKGDIDCEMDKYIFWESSHKSLQKNKESKKAFTLKKL